MNISGKWKNKKKMSHAFANCFLWMASNDFKRPTSVRSCCPGQPCDRGWNSTIWCIPFPHEVMTTRTKKGSAPQEAVSAPEAASVPRKGPLESIRLDDCSASLWARKRESQGAEKTYWSITFERSYVDKAGTRRYTGFFSPDD